MAIPLLQIFGSALIGLVLLYGFLVVISRVQEIRQSKRFNEYEANRFKREIKRVSEAYLTKADNESAAWCGYRKFELVKKIDETDDVLSFLFAPHDGKRLPRFNPGQYLSFKFFIPGRLKPVVRCYSLSDCYRDGRYYQITVKKEVTKTESGEVKPGLVSSYLHQDLSSGDYVDVQAPRGNFCIDVDEHLPALVMIAGGVGITPMLAMLSSLAESGFKREVWLFYSVYDGSKHIQKNWLKSLAKLYDNFHYHIFYTAPLKSDKQGEGYHHQGLINLEQVKKILPSNNFTFLVCGPPGLMDTITTALVSWGVPSDHVLTEAFGPSCAKSTALATETLESSPEEVSITFARSGVKAKWGHTDGSLLELAERHGVVIDNGCRAGSCGSCQLAIKSGEVTYFNEPDAEVEKGSCLACIAVPKTDLIIDA